jgi:hypothetical protein
MGERVRETTTRLLREHRTEPLPRDVGREMERILARADARLDRPWDPDIL